jgi:hypothetical protein
MTCSADLRHGEHLGTPNRSICGQHVCEAGFYISVPILQVALGEWECNRVGSGQSCVFGDEFAATFE